MKTLSKLTRKKFEILIISLIAVFFIISLLFDSFHFQPFSWLISKDVTFFKELFTVQATISTLSIAIVSILSGFITVSYYGVSVAKYISEIKPFILKHKYVIIFGLVLTFLNYFFTALSLYNLSVFCFWLSICSAIYLSRDIYFIYLGKDTIREDIFKYYSEQSQKLGMGHLKQSLLKDEASDNYTTFEEEIKLFKEIYTRALKSPDVNLEEMDLILCDVFLKLQKEKNTFQIFELIKLVSETYKEANSIKPPVALKLWDKIGYHIYDSFSELNFSEWEVRNTAANLNKDLYLNQKIIKEKVPDFYDEVIEEINAYNCKSLTDYGENIFRALKKGNNTQKTTDNVLSDIILQIYSLLDKEKNEDELSRYKTKLLLTELCKLFRMLAYYGEIDLIQKYIFDHNNTNNDITAAKLILMIYLYYISLDPLFDKEQKASAKTIININKSAVFHFFSRLKSDFIQEYFKYICDVMWGWEQIPEKGGKTLIIDRAISDVLIYSFAAVGRVGKEHELAEVIYTVHQGNLNLAYFLYVREQGDTLQQLIKQVTEFFCLRTSFDCKSEASLIIKVILDLCLKHEIKNLRNTGWESRIKLQSAVSSSVETWMESNSFLFKEPDKKRLLQPKKMEKLLYFSAPYAFSAEEFSERYESYIESKITEIIISLGVREKRIEIQTKKRNFKEKQNLLINMAKKHSLNTDTLIGGIEYFDYESDPGKLMRYCKDYHKIETENSGKRIYLIDSTKIKASVSDIQFLMYKLSDKELNQRKKTADDGTITYQTVYNEYLPFSKNMYRKYLNQNVKNILITAYIEISFEDGICGVGLEIE